MKPLLALICAVCCARSSSAAEPEIKFSLDGPKVQRSGERTPGPDAPSAVSLRIDHDRSTLTWTDDALKQQVFRLDVIANHPGPAPCSENLSWLVARSKDDFWILWVYVNEVGHSCYINYYHFAENRVRMDLFLGSYVYRPPSSFPAAPFDIDVPLEKVPAWKGRAFKHKDFGPLGGVFPKLRYLEGSAWKERNEKLLVKPLVDLEVEGNNGWSSQPWTEVHCLARSEDGARLYYVVTYSAVNHGWVVDLKDGRVLKTHFGEAVKVEPKEPK